MSGKLPLVLVASLALVSVVAAHSVEKRQTTVNSVISSLFRGLEGAVPRTVVEGYGAFFIVLFLIIMPVFVILNVLRDSGIIGAIGRRSYEDISWLSGVRNMDNSLDIVETGFRYMDIEDESCRLKTICELESYAVSHPLASLAINTINSNLRGLDRYQTAIQAGINGEDCALIYDQCRVSYVGY